MRTKIEHAGASSRARRMALSLIAALAVGVAQEARASGIDSWDGARIEVLAADQERSERGRGVSGSVEGSAVLSYIAGPGNGVYYSYTVGVGGTASASATGRPSGLLRVETEAYAGNPGTRPFDVSPWPGVRASASWTGDSVRVRTPGDGAAPDSVRMTFALDFELEPGGDYAFGMPFGQFRVDANGTRMDGALWVPNHWSWYGYPQTWGDQLSRRPFDAVELETPPESFEGRGRATFHVDLAVGPDGTSDPFDLLLESDPTIPVYSNTGRSARHAFTLSLLDVTLPDGTSLTGAGYDVSFASGLFWPEPVPEPLPIAAWALIAAGAAARRRRRVAPRRD